MPPTGTLIELGYVVRDLKSAAAWFGATMNVGPFFLFEKMQMGDARYLGKETAPWIDVALGRCNEIIIELIVQHDESPSPFHAPSIGELTRFNHWSVFVDDFDQQRARYESDGFKSVLTASFGAREPARIAYLSCPGQSGCYLELMESHPRDIFDTYARILETATHSGDIGKLIAP